MIGVLLVVLIAYSRAQSGNSQSKNGLHTAPSVHHHQQGIYWSNFDDIVEIDKDSEWQEYHDKVLFKDNKQQPTKNTKAGRRKPIIIVDESFRSNAKTYKGLQDAKRRWLLQKSDPEKFEREKKEYSDRRREKVLMRKSLLNFSNSSVESQIYQKQKREKETKKINRHKKLTGYSHYRSSKLNRLRNLVDNKEATSKQIEELENMREKDKIRHRQHRAKKKLEGLQAANNNNKRV